MKSSNDNMDFQQQQNHTKDTKYHRERVQTTNQMLDLQIYQVVDVTVVWLNCTPAQISPKNSPHKTNIAFLSLFKEPQYP